MNNLMEVFGDICGDRFVLSEELFYRVVFILIGCKMMEMDIKFGYLVNVVFGELCFGEVICLVFVFILIFFEIYFIVVFNFILKF